MKQNLILFVAISTGISSTAVSQIHRGTVETSLSAAFGSLSFISETIGPNFDISVSGKSVHYFSAFARAGYFMSRAIEGELELHVFTASMSSPTSIYSLNFSYNIPISQSQFVPFVLIGGGYATGTLLSLAGTDQAYPSGYAVVNLGAGLKYLIADNLALRSEYRYQQLTSLELLSFSPWTSTSTTTVNYENLLLGFSVLF